MQVIVTRIKWLPKQCDSVLEGKPLIQIMITRGKEETLLLIDKVNIIQLKIVRLIQTKIGNIHTPINNLYIEQSRYTSSQLIQESNLIGLKT